MVFQVQAALPFIPGKPHRHIVYTSRLCVNVPQRVVRSLARAVVRELANERARIS
jgi:hypothetical protein